MPAPPDIALLRVGHAFTPEHWLFRDISHSFPRGSVTALTGPSGSGKSTLLHILAGWLTPAAGHTAGLEGIRVKWVFQNPHGVPRRTALDHVALPYSARGLPRATAEELASEMLDRVGLTGVSGRLFQELSGGEAQRLMLARGLASAPELLLVDEPTAQLDRGTAQRVNRALARVAGLETSVVVATHDEATRDACSAQLDLLKYTPSR